MIRIEMIWLALGASDLRGGIDVLLAQVLLGFAGGAQAHHAYVFANRRADRLKVLVYDGVGMWLCTRRLQAGGFAWPRTRLDPGYAFRERHPCVVDGDVLRECYAATASRVALCVSAATEVTEARQLCGKSCARSAFFSVGSRSNTSFK